MSNGHVAPSRITSASSRTVPPVSRSTNSSSIREEELIRQAEATAATRAALLTARENALTAIEAWIAQGVSVEFAEGSTTKILLFRYADAGPPDDEDAVATAEEPAPASEETAVAEEPVPVAVERVEQAALGEAASRGDEGGEPRELAAEAAAVELPEPVAVDEIDEDADAGHAAFEADFDAAEAADIAADWLAYV